MQFNLIILILCIALIIFSALGIFAMKLPADLAHEKSWRGKKGLKIIGRCAIIIDVIILILFICVAIIFGTAKNHGLYKSEMDGITINQMVSNIKQTPVEDTKLPKDTKGSIIIFYRFTCDDCTSIYEDLYNKVKDNDKVYWISSRSKLGKELIEKYDVEEVPMGVYIRNEDYNGNVEATKYNLMKFDGKTTKLDEKAINRLLDIQKEGR